MRSVRSIKMKYTMYLVLLLVVVTTSGCVQPPPTHRGVSIRRTSLAALVTDDISSVGVTLQRPRPTWSRGWGNPLIQFNSVVTSPGYIGDTQYMTTISVEKHTTTQWADHLERGNRIAANSPQPDWRDFTKWFYSEPSETEMRERNGYRYYLRVIKDSEVGVVEIRGEHNCYQRESLQDDDEIIRTMIDSVTVTDKVKDR